MPHDAEIEISPNWPQPDAAGRYALHPSGKKLFQNCLFCAFLFFGTLLPARPGHPLDQIFDPIGGCFFGTILLFLPFAAWLGLFTLTIDEVGFSDGAPRCSWADIKGSFHLRTNKSGLKLLVRYRMGKGDRQILNIYPLDTQALADFMNARLAAFATHPPAISTLPPAPAFRQRVVLWQRLLCAACATASLAVWLAIKHSE